MRFYYTPPGRVEWCGPFSECVMLEGYRRSYFPSTLVIRCEKDERELYTTTLYDLATRNGTANPFMYLERDGEATLSSRLSAVESQLADRPRMRDVIALQDQMAVLQRRLDAMEGRSGGNAATSPGHETVQEKLRDVLHSVDRISEMINGRKREKGGSDEVAGVVSVPVQRNESRCMVREVCWFAGIDWPLLSRLSSLPHMPLLERNAKAGKALAHDALNMEMMELRARWHKRRFADARLNKLFMENFGDCAVCDESFDTASEMLGHVVSVAHLRKLHRGKLLGPGYDSSDVAFWTWVVDKLEKDKEQ